MSGQLKIAYRHQLPGSFALPSALVGLCSIRAGFNHDFMQKKSLSMYGPKRSSGRMLLDDQGGFYHPMVIGHDAMTNKKRP